MSIFSSPSPQLFPAASHGGGVFQRRISPPALFLFLWSAGLTAVCSAADGREPVSYFKDIRPVLEAQCHGCHQPAKAKGDYVMTDFTKLVAGAGEGAAIVPGKPEESVLMKMITPGENGEAQMPQKKPPLFPAQIDLVKRWISEGAKDDTPPDAYIKYSAEKPPVYAAPPVTAALDWSPDGQWIAVAGHSEVLLHRADGSGIEARLIGMSERVESVAFSPDGKKLAVTGGNPGRRGEVQIWDVKSKKLDLSHPVTFDTVYGASWSPDGTKLAFGCGDHGDNSVKAIEAATGKEIVSNSAHGDWALDTAWSLDGSHIVSAGRDMAAKLTDVATQRFIDNITSITPGALRGGLQSVARHPLRDEVLLGGSDGVPQVYRIQRVTVRVIGDNANLIRRFAPLPGRVSAVAWSPDGKHFAAVSAHAGGGALHIEEAAYDPDMPDDIKAIVQKTVDGQTAEEKTRLESWVTAGVKNLHSLTFPDIRLYALDYSPDGKWIAAAGQGGRVHVINAEAGTEARSFEVAPVDPAALARQRPPAPAASPEIVKPGEKPEPAPDPAEIAALEVMPETAVLDGSTDSCQVLVTARRKDGTVLDATRFVTTAWSAPAGEISRNGMLRPLRDGAARVTFTLGAASATLPVKVSGTAAPLQPDYVRDVMPVLSKLGCNAGTCHGAKDGRNGFKLSLRGYDPEFDVLALTDEQAARRACNAVPDSSFFLQKASAAVPHEGGQLTAPGSDSYEILRAWIGQGSDVNLKAPRVTGIEVFPKNPVVERVGERRQMRVLATYADGKTRDVSAYSFIETGNQDVASVSGTGLVSTLRRGEAPLLARFEGAYAATTLTVMGDRSGFVWTEPPVFSEIDRLVAAKWQRMKIQPSELCSDGEFFRRVYLDLTGLPPSAEEVEKFLADGRDTRVKRDEVVDRLIGSPAFVEFWSNKWADLLQVNGKFLGREGAETFRNWIRQSVEKNTPWNEMVFNILTATGSNAANPPASYFKILRTPEELMENTTHLFLATRFNCNKCHDHPFERWTQDQYYETAAWFAQTGLKPAPESNGRNIGGSAVENPRPLFEITEDLPQGEVTHDRTKQVTPPDFPYPATYEKRDGMTRRQEFAAWLTANDNRYFAMSFVNRIWGYLLGTGIIEPLDDIRAGNPPANPELLEHLRSEFINGGFDMRRLMTMICKSRTYQLSVASNKWNEDDATNFSHAKARRLPAEALFDSIIAVTGSQPNIPGVSPGTRAAALPDAALDLPSGFLANLGRPVRESACECERSNDMQLGPVMSLLGGPVVAGAINDPGNAVSALVQAEADDTKLIDRLFMRVLNRHATPEETESALSLRESLARDHQALLEQLVKAEADDAPRRVRAEIAREEAILAAETALKEDEPKVAERLKAAEEARLAGIQKAKDALTESDRVRGASLTAWKHPHLQNPNAPVWHTPKVISAKASGETKLEAQPDGSFIATAPAADYTLELEAALPRVTGLILEVLPDPSLPSGGPGLAGNGNFVLNQLTASWVSSEDAARTGMVMFDAAKATFSQAGFDPALALAAAPDPNKGWALMGAPATRHSASFKFKEPLLTEAKGARFTVTLRHRFPDNMHTLGRFRISFTDAENPLEPGASAAVHEALAVAPEQRTEAQHAALSQEAGLLDPARGELVRGAVAAHLPVPPDTRSLELKAALAAAQQPVPVLSKVLRLRQDMAQSVQQMNGSRLTAAQDLVWALINSPAFLFNH